MLLYSKSQSLSANQISSKYINSRLRYNYFRFAKKTNVRNIRILLPISISIISPQLACYFASDCWISSKRDHSLQKYDVIPIFQNGGAAAKYYFRFPTCWCYCIRKVKVYRQTKFRRHISLDGWDITTSMFKKQTSAILYSNSGIDFDHLAVICMLFCIRLPNFVHIRAPTAEIWRHIQFSRWRPRPLKTTSGFLFVNVTAFKRSNSISKPNFVDISQLPAEI